MSSKPVTSSPKTSNVKNCLSTTLESDKLGVALLPTSSTKAIFLFSLYPVLLLILVLQYYSSERGNKLEEMCKRGQKQAKRKEMRQLQITF